MNKNNHKESFKKALLVTLLIFTIGLVMFLFLDLYWLVFYILIIVSLSFGGIKYIEYRSSTTVKDTNENIDNI